MSEATPILGAVPREVVDLARVADWMDAQGLGRGEFEHVELLAGGTQNVLMLLRRDGTDYVLRRPPPHLRRNSNETMRREARVLAALAGSDVPHPRLIAACPSEDVIGAAFYLMEPVEGFNPSQGLPALHRGSAAIRRGMGFSLVDSIAALGRVDHRAVGLEGFGRPEGFDALAHLTQSLATLPRAHAIEVLLHADLDRARRETFDAIGVFTPEGDAVRLSARTDDLDWFARELARLPFDFTVLSPPALRETVGRLAARLRRLARRTKPETSGAPVVSGSSPTRQHSRGRQT